MSYIINHAHNVLHVIRPYNNTITCKQIYTLAYEHTYHVLSRKGGENLSCIEPKRRRKHTYYESILLIKHSSIIVTIS